VLWCSGREEEYGS